MLAIPPSDAQHTVFFYSAIHKYTGMNVIAPFHPETYVWCMMASGSGLIALDHQTFQMASSRLYWLTPSISVSITLHSEDSECYLIFMEPLMLAKQRGKWGIARNLALPSVLQPGEIALQNTGKLLLHAEKLYAEQLHAESLDCHIEESGLHLQHTFQQLHSFIMQDLLEQQSKDPSAKKLFDLSIKYMHTHFDEKITLETLAGLAQLTPTSYSRSFKKEMGISPIEYLTGLRMKHAKESLLKNNSTVTEIAAAVGYSNPFYFSQTFKKATGISPTLYLKRKQLKVATASCFYFTDDLIALGTEPVAAVDCFHYPGIAPADHQRLLTASLNEIRRAQPDLILCDQYHLSFLEQLKGIAPAVVLRLHAEWRDSYSKMAEIVGGEEKAKHALAQLEFNIHDAREQLRHALGKETLTVMRVDHRLVRIQGRGGHPLNKLLYDELGISPGSIVPPDQTSVYYEPEAVPSLETDHLLLQKHHLQAGSEKVFSQLQRAKHWDGMPAIQKDNILLISNWFLMSYSPAGRKRIIENLLHYTSG
ncbi:HTH-type transcriptional activator RhaS [Paenibacillus plantiphilus]|uniref:HTH-type transcriptional activator RhaS n=1 Tax=Paenibacillus plantiphilus TaxID=2905650 RepID=A0ABN8G339_9BACL|nr:helix-turn-helix domain-containing protein [Paenibacillus plantiphilus]CAH1197631.1 HTH-type transcriptional activator RhaS [Paenibacillus plantiphilus]